MVRCGQEEDGMMQDGIHGVFPFLFILSCPCPA